MEFENVKKIIAVKQLMQLRKERLKKVRLAAIRTLDLCDNSAAI